MKAYISKIVRRIVATAGLLTTTMGVLSAQNPDSEPVINQNPGGNNYISMRRYVNQSGTSYVTNVEYYNGLGYLVQKQSSHATPNGGVLVQPVVYDNMQRADATAYLPYSSGRFTMTYIPNAVSEQNSWYASRYEGGGYAFSSTVYESGPQGRPIGTMKPGSAYRNGNHKAEISYSLNEASDSVRRFSFDPPGFCILPEGYYPEHSIKRITTTDEDGRASTVFCDAFGRTLLTRQYEDVGENGRRCDTYYVYDACDSLICAIQPEGVPHIEESMAESSDEISLDADFIKNYCFTWEYDAWGNIISSHVPGGGLSIFKYDERDRCTFFSDSDMSRHSACIHREYDDMDRLIAEYYGTGFSEDEFYDYAQIRKVCYYDASGSHIPSNRDLEYRTDASAGAEQVCNERCLTLPSYEYVLECPESIQQEDANIDGVYVERAFYYDNKGRLIQTVEIGSDGWQSIYSTEYDFTGNIIATRESHTPPQGTEDILITRYSYDMRGRMLSSSVTLNGHRQHDVHYDYDELGRPVGKEFCTAEGEDGVPVVLANEILTRNLQGWLKNTEQNLDSLELFRQEFGYYEGQFGSPMYSGMISGTRFSRGVMDEGHIYSYSYDGMGRLTGSNHKDFLGTAMATDYENDIHYDRNGNILALKRYGSDFNSFTGDCLTDDLAYLYSGNQVQRITNRALPLDETGETEEDPGTKYCFSYDSNGRITGDDHQGLEIRYNLLNLPCYLYDTDAMSELDCTYLYDGSKYDVSSPEGMCHHYRGSFIYFGDDSRGSTPSLESVATPDGRLFIDGDGIRDLWYAKDYLGNVRTVVDLDSGILEENDYLPFGTRIQDNTQARMDSNAGKEELSPLVSENCHLIDFGARAYDPWSARWTSIDPMAQKYAGMSPYNYCAGNPVMMIDPDGNDWVFSIEDSTYVWMPDVTEYSVLPSNLRYIGENHNDILKDLNLPQELIHITSKGKLFYGGNDNRSAFILPYRVSGDAYLKFDIVENYKGGKFIADQVSISSSVITPDLTRSEIIFDPSGGVVIEGSNNIKLSSFMFSCPPNGSIFSSGTVALSGTGCVPISKALKSGGIRKVTMTVGSISSNYFFTNDFIWKK